MRFKWRASLKCGYWLLSFCVPKFRFGNAVSYVYVQTMSIGLGRGISSCGEWDEWFNAEFVFSLIIHICNSLSAKYVRPRTSSISKFRSDG